MESTNAERAKEGEKRLNALRLPLESGTSDSVTRHARERALWTVCSGLAVVLIGLAGYTLRMPAQVPPPQEIATVTAPSPVAPAPAPEAPRRVPKVAGSRTRSRLRGKVRSASTR